MLPTNANFDTKHASSQKQPMYLIHFDGETTDYATRTPVSPDNDVKEYIVRISGLSQRVEPEEGRASIGGLTIEILDKDDEITTMLGTDSYQFHRKKTTVKAGYAGMAEADMLTIFTGWVTGIKLSSNLLTYIFEITDPMKWAQRLVFRTASDASPQVISGNAINIFLAVMTSTGAGTNGDYDWYIEENGLGLSTDHINVTAIEEVRDRWYPGDSYYMHFTIKKRMKAKDFIETEIFKVLNCYPVIDGQGRLSLKPFKPPLPAIETVQSFDEDNIVGTPTWDANLSDLVNEVEIFYNWDSTNDEFLDEIYYVDANSVDNRGPGKKPITIKTKGLHTEGIGSQPARGISIIEARKTKIFSRFATPPIKINIKAWFSRWLSEAGDVVPFTHWLVPDIETGVRGYTNERMEIINREVDWARGNVKFELLNTGFEKSDYAVISPTMTVTTASDTTSFTVASTDALQYEEGWEVNVFDAGMREKATNITLTAIDTTTGLIYCDDIGTTPAAGWVIQFADYSNLTTSQQLYWACKAANAHPITP